MNVDSILIAEFAKVDERGRLTVIDAFNNLSGPGPVWGLPVMAVSLVIHGHRAEAGTRHKVDMRLIDASRKDVVPPMHFEFSFPEDNGKLDEGVPLRQPWTFGMIGVSFNKPGIYAFEVQIDGTYAASASLLVKRTDQP